MAATKQRGFTAADTVRFVIVTLAKMARDRAWGEIRITVQGGQIEFCHYGESFRDRLPTMAGTEGDTTLATAAAAAGQ